MGLDPEGKYIAKTSRDKLGKITQSVYPYNPRLLGKEGLYREVTYEEALLVEQGKVIPQAMPLEQLEGKTTMFIPDEYVERVMDLLRRLADGETETMSATPDMPEVTITKDLDNTIIDLKTAPKDDMGNDSPDGNREETFEMVKVRKMQSKNAVEGFVMDNFAEDLPRDMELDEMKDHAVTLLKMRDEVAAELVEAEEAQTEDETKETGIPTKE